MAGVPALIGLDWGTSHFRAALLDRDGTIIEERTSGDGLASIVEHAFEPVLDTEIAGWEEAHPGLPIIASGMVTSRQGWTETPYVPCPAALSALADGLVAVRTTGGRTVHFVPGLSFQGENQAPDVIRGEEMQILGATGGPAKRSIVLPGTHSKWALVEGERVLAFKTWITGDVFAALKGHTILRFFMESSTVSEDAFLRGLAAGIDQLGAGLLGKLFSARTLGLFGLMAPDALTDYLSGLLIGTEIAEAEQAGYLLRSAPITVVGTASLTERYLSALTHLGFAAEGYKLTAASIGHAKIAAAAGLLA